MYKLLFATKSAARRQRRRRRRRRRRTGRQAELSLSFFHIFEQIKNFFHFFFHFYLLKNMKKFRESSACLPVCRRRRRRRRCRRAAAHCPQPTARCASAGPSTGYLLRLLQFFPQIIEITSKIYSVFLSDIWKFD